MLMCLPVTDDKTQEIDQDVEAEANDPSPKDSEIAELVDDLNPVADLGDTLSKLNSRYLTVLLLTYLVATGVGMLTVLINPVRDWLLFGGMFLVILAYIILYIKAHQKKRPILRLLSLAFSVSLLSFWTYILLDRIPERMVFVNGEILVRPPLTLLWVPILLLGLVAIGLVAHWAFISRMVERNWNEAAA
jgi:hypothetical protein